MQLFLLGLFLFILSFYLDSRKLFRIYVNYRGRGGKFADQNIAGSFFLSRNTWSIILIESDRDLRKTCICKEMKIGGDEYSYRDKQDLLKAFVRQRSGL